MFKLKLSDVPGFQDDTEIEGATMEQLRDNVESYLRTHKEKSKHWDGLPAAMKEKARAQMIKASREV